MAAVGASLAELEGDLENARRRYASLKAQVAKRAFRHVLVAQDQVAAADAGASNVQSRKDNVTVACAKSSSKRRRVGDVHTAYRLSGLSMFHVAPGQSGIRFETCWGGKYWEQYYTFMKDGENDGESPTLYKHTLPAFVPIIKMQELLRSGGLKPFMLAISSYLNAFVARREQARELQRIWDDRLQGQVMCSPAVDYISFEVSGRFSVRLLYENLESVLPTRAVARSTSSDSGQKAQRLRVAETAFKKSVLPGVLDSIE